jgi:hypothetical protein
MYCQLEGQGIRCRLDERQLLPGDDLLDGIDWSIRIWDSPVIKQNRATAQWPVIVKQAPSASAPSR